MLKIHRGLVGITALSLSQLLKRLPAGARGTFLVSRILYSYRVHVCFSRIFKSRTRPVDL